MPKVFVSVCTGFLVLFVGAAGVRAQSREGEFIANEWDREVLNKAHTPIKKWDDGQDPFALRLNEAYVEDIEEMAHLPLRYHEEDGKIDFDDVLESQKEIKGHDSRQQPVYYSEDGYLMRNTD